MCAIGRFGVAAVVHEQRRHVEPLQFLDAIDLGKAHAVTMFEAVPHRLAHAWRDPEQTREVMRVLFERRRRADENDAPEPYAAPECQADGRSAKRMADRSGERSVRRGQCFHCAHEIGQGDGAAGVVSVAWLIEPHGAISALEQGGDEAAHLHAAPAPAVNEQDRRGPRRPRLPDREQVFARNDGFSPGVDRLRSAARVTRREGKQALRVAACETREESAGNREIRADKRPNRNYRHDRAI